MKVRQPDHVNNELNLNEPPYAIDYPAIEGVTSKPETFVRVYEAGYNNPQSQWLVKLSGIEDILDNPSALRDRLALPNKTNGDPVIVDKMITANVPEDFPLRLGKIGPTSGGNGGVVQFQLMENLEVEYWGQIINL